MKLSSKIGSGYTIIIIIALILGGIAVYNMNKVKSESNVLAQQYVPGVSIEAKLEGQINRLMFQIRGYSYTRNEEFYKQAETTFTQIFETADEGIKHAGTNSELSEMKQKIGEIKKNIQKYNTLFGNTKKVFMDRRAARLLIDESAVVYMKNANDYLVSQDVALKNTLDKGNARTEQMVGMIDLSVQANELTNQLIDSKKISAGNEGIAVLNTGLGTIEDFIKGSKNSEIASQAKTIKRDIEEIRSLFTVTMGGSLTDSAKLNKTEARIEELCAEIHRLGMVLYKNEKTHMTEDIISRTRKIELARAITNLGNDARVKIQKSQARRDDKIMEDAFTNFKKINELLDKIGVITFKDINKKQLAAIKTSSDNFQAAMKSYLDCNSQLVELAKERVKLGGDSLKITAELSKEGLESTQDIADSASGLLSFSSIVMVVGLIIAIVVSVALAIVLTAGITKSINAVISGLRKGSDQVTSASEEVSSSSQSLSQGASEQAASLEEISSSLEEMTSMTRQNSDNASQANNMSSGAADMARKGAEAMNRMGVAINKIKDSSDETAKIIKTIDEIAFQTNLLALNAAVEAARAGEAGKGFAVVAEEVRNLAQRSAEAAKDTSALIEESQSNAENGVKVSQEVNEMLSEIVGSVVKVAELVNEVAAASKEQSQGIDQISKAVSQLDQVTQSNAANAEESASASEELSAQAVDLTSMVNQLVTLVKGQVSDFSSGSFKSLGAARQAYNLPAAKPKSAKPAAKSMDKSNYEKVIPLEDEDFSDF